MTEQSNYMRVVGPHYCIRCEGFECETSEEMMEHLNSKHPGWMTETLRPEMMTKPTKDRAAEVSANYGWMSLAECLNAQAMFRQATLETLAAVVECIRTKKWDSLYDIQHYIQSLTVSGVSLEKFAERVRRECMKLVHDDSGVVLDFAAIIKKTYDDAQAELRQPITDKSICKVGHVKANLVEKGKWSTRLDKWEPICLACQGERERRER